MLAGVQVELGGGPPSTVPVVDPRAVLERVRHFEEISGVPATYIDAADLVEHVRVPQRRR